MAPFGSQIAINDNRSAQQQRLRWVYHKGSVSRKRIENDRAMQGISSIQTVKQPGGTGTGSAGIVWRYLTPTAVS